MRERDKERERERGGVSVRLNRRFSKLKCKEES